MAVSPGVETPSLCRDLISSAMKFASSCSLSATYPTSGVPAPASDHKFFSLRLSFWVITALAALRMFWVER